jgi:hypothetical protein
VVTWLQGGLDENSGTITCQIDTCPSANIDLSIQKGSGSQTPVATVVVSHAVIGNGTYVYPIRAGEDLQVQTFLVQAAFPPLSDAIVIASNMS